MTSSEEEFRVLSMLRMVFGSEKRFSEKFVCVVVTTAADFSRSLAKGMDFPWLMSEGIKREVPA
jgi:hypothetical protein